ncbi:MAG: hypothetical protein Q9180_002493, partial [Flavoplaca navasiana]
LAQSPAQAPAAGAPAGAPAAVAPAGAPAPIPDPASEADPDSGVYPPDSLSEPWPSIAPPYNLSLSTDPLPYLARDISRVGVQALLVQIHGEVTKQIKQRGNQIITSDLDIAEPIEVVGSGIARGIKFGICRISVGGMMHRNADHDYVDDGNLRWHDIVPVILAIRTKMNHDRQWRERAVWIKQKVTEVRLGAARIVSTTSGFEPGDPNVLPWACD